MSNHTNDPWEAEMSRTFDQRVRDLHEAPLSLDQVKGKATRIRRTRRLAAAGGALAAAAVIVPIMVFAGGALTDDSSPPVAPKPDETAKDSEGAGFGYLEGRTLHLEDGSTVRLAERYYGATILGEEILAVRNNDDTGLDTIDVIDETGEVSESIEVQSGPVINDDHTVVAYLQADGTLKIRWDGGNATATSPGLGQNDYLAAVTGGPECASDPASCRVYINDGISASPPRVVSLEGQQIAVPNAIKVNDADEEGLLTVQNKSTVDGSCGGIYDENAGDYLWETCDYFLFDFSSDSRYVNATHPYLDGIGYSYAAILDAATGQEVARLEPPEGFIAEAVWLDAEHLLATVHDTEGWSIYRLGVDGTVEQVVGPSTKGDDLSPAYILLG